MANPWNDLAIDEVNSIIAGSEIERHNPTPSAVVAELFSAAQHFKAALTEVAINAPLDFGPALIESATRQISNDIDMATGIVTSRAKWNNAGDADDSTEPADATEPPEDETPEQ